MHSAHCAGEKRVCLLNAVNVSYWLNVYVKILSPLSVSELNWILKFQQGHPYRGIKYRWDMEIRFSVSSDTFAQVTSPLFLHCVSPCLPDLCSQHRQSRCVDCYLFR